MDFTLDQNQVSIAEMIREFARKHIAPVEKDGSLKFKKIEIVTGAKLLGFKIDHSFSRKDFLDLCDFARNEYGQHLTFKQDRIDDLILNIYKDKKNLLVLDWHELELITQRLFRTCGYIVKPTKKTRDNGYDMLAIKGGLFKTCAVIECKSTKSLAKVGVEKIRHLAYVTDKLCATTGILVTNYEFTRDAIKEALTMPFKIFLVNGKKLLSMIKDYVHQACNFKKITLSIA